jgi:tetratricopeptide (TPR) repeat protein
LLAGYELLLREGDVPGAQQALRDIVERYPRALEAWYLLGYVQFNLRALLGSSLAESRVAFRRALDRDSSFATALWHLALISVLENNDNAARDYLERFLKVDSTSLQAEIAHTYDSLLFRGVGSLNRVLGSLNERSTGVLEVLSLGAGELRPPPGVRPIAREALNAFWNNAGSRSERQVAFRMRLAYLLARGRYASADTLFREAERARIPQGELDRWIVLSAITPLPDLAGETVQRAAVTRLQNAEEDVAESLWLVARWHLEYGSDNAVQYVEALAELAADADRTTPLARSLSMDIEAQNHLANGDSILALEKLTEAAERHSVDQLMFGLTASLWHLRLRRAGIAAQSGQQETVLGIAATFDQMAAVIDQVAWPEILRIKAEAARASNDMLLARTTYEELLGVLEEANGEGVLLRESAERAMEELGGRTERR